MMEEETVDLWLLHSRLVAAVALVRLASMRRQMTSLEMEAPEQQTPSVAVA
jgi:hypothetical protein